jgi:predicted nucleic acid-binding protein
VAEVISNTSPLLYLYRVQAIDLLPEMFGGAWTPGAVVQELRAGREKGYDVPDPSEYPWLRVMDPKVVPSEWLAADLGSGELAALSLALENPERIILLDDALARRIAQKAGLTVWGTLKVLLEAKSRGLVETLTPLVDRLERTGMRISSSVRLRVLALAGEAE